VGSVSKAVCLRMRVHSERNCADTIGTVLVLGAGHLQYQNKSNQIHLLKTSHLNAASGNKAQSALTVTLVYKYKYIYNL